MKVVALSLLFVASVSILEDDAKLLRSPMDLTSTMSHAEFEQADSDLFKIASLGLTTTELDVTFSGQLAKKFRNVINEGLVRNITTKTFPVILILKLWENDSKVFPNDTEIVGG